MVGKSGNDAMKTIACSFLSSFENDENELDCMSRILLRNLRVGIDIKMVNSALGFKAIDSFDVQLCEPFEKEYDEPMIHEPKLDGVRLLTVIEPNISIKFYTRNGKELTGYEDIKINLERIFMVYKSNLINQERKVFTGVVLDGEIFDTDFDGTMNNLFRKSDNKKGTYNIFDIIELEQFNNQNCTEMLSQRKYKLGTIFFKDELIKLGIDNITTVPYGAFYFISDYTDINLIMKHYVSKGFEGMIIKRLNSLYQFKRTYDWQKIKPFETIDLDIDEIVEGTGKYSGMMGSVYVMHKGCRVKVGSGFSDELRRDIWDNPDKYLGVTIEIQYQDITKDNSLRFPSFKRFRHDK